jgi:hypothetical protein
MKSNCFAFPVIILTFVKADFREAESSPTITMKFSSTLYLAICLASWLPSLCLGQLLEQDFSSSPVLGAYFSGSPTNGQFDAFPVTGGPTVDIVGNALQWQRSGTGTAAIVRSTNLAASANTIIWRFDVNVTASTANASPALRVLIGSGFNNGAATEADAQVAGRFGIRLVNSSTNWRVLTLPAVGAPTEVGTAVTGRHRVAVAVNTSGAAVTYAAPSAINETLANNTFDVFVDGTRVINDAACITNNLQLTDFKLLFEDGTATINLDNFHANPLNVYSGSYLVGPIGDFQNFSGDNGAFRALNGTLSGAPANTITTNLNLKVNADITTETGTHALRLLPSMPANTIRITPETAITYLIDGSPGADNGMIRLDGAQGVTIDGRAPGVTDTTHTGRFLTLRNRRNSGNANMATLMLINGAQNNSFVALNIFGRGTSAASGVVKVDVGTASTGNNNNLWAYCDIGPEGTNRPATLFYSNGTSATVPNASNLIRNCWLRDYDYGASSRAIINLAANNTGWVFEDNSLYCTYNRAPNSGHTTQYMFRIQGGSGHIVRRNYLGGNSPRALGTWSLLGGAAASNCFRMRCLEITGVTGTITVSDNVFRNMTVTGYPNSGEEIGYRALITGGAATFIIERDTVESIQLKNETTAAVAPNFGGYALYALSLAGTGNLTVNACVIRNLSTISDVNFNDRPVNLVGIQLNGGTYTVHHNQVENLTNYSVETSRSAVRGIQLTAGGSYDLSANVITGCSGASGRVYGLQQAGSNTTVTATGNTISNLNGATSTLTAPDLQVCGIRLSAPGQITLTSNTVNGIRNGNENVTLAGNAIGISLASATASGNILIQDNDIFDIHATATTAVGTHATAIGIATQCPSIEIRRNFIYDIRNSSTKTATTNPRAASGISIQAIGSVGTTGLTIHTNMLSLGLTQQQNGLANTTNAAFIGIWASGTAPSIADRVNIYYNTVLISGVASSGNVPSYALLRGDLAGGAVELPLFLRNNILLNTRTGGGMTPYYGIAVEGSNANWSGGSNPSSSHNLVWGSSYVGSWLGAAQATLTDWFIASGGSDDPAFSVSHDITASFYAINQPTNPPGKADPVRARLFLDINETRVNSYGTPAIYYPDIEGERRRGTDLGADEVRNIKTYIGGANIESPWAWDYMQVPTCADSVVFQPGTHAYKPYSTSPVYPDSSTKSLPNSISIEAGSVLLFESMYISPDFNMAVSMNMPSTIFEGCWADGVLRNEGTIRSGKGIFRLAGDFINNNHYLSFARDSIIMNIDTVIHATPDHQIFHGTFNNPLRTVRIKGFTLDAELRDVVHNLSVINQARLLLDVNPRLNVCTPFTNDLGVLFIQQGSTIVLNSSQLVVNGKITGTGTLTGSPSSIFGFGYTPLTATDPHAGTFYMEPGHDTLFILGMANESDLGVMRSATAGTNVYCSNFIFLEQDGRFDARTGAEVIKVIDPSPGSVTATPWRMKHNHIVNMKFTRQVTPGQSYTFPMGDATRPNHIVITPQTGNGLTDITMQFHPVTPATPVFVPRWDFGAYLEELIPGGYWDIESNAGASGVTYNLGAYPVGFAGLTFDNTDYPMTLNLNAASSVYQAVTLVKNGVEDPAGWGHYYTDCEPYNFDGTIEHDGIDNQDGEIRRIKFRNFSRFALAGSKIAPFPVELVSFTATLERNRDARLNFVTATETNNKGFELEVSFDGRQFEQFGFIAGQGTKTTPTAYTSLYPNLPIGTTYFRLKQLDFSGNAKYSTIAAVSRSLTTGSAPRLVLNSNPVDTDSRLTIEGQWEEPLQLRILDITGRVVWHTQLSANQDGRSQDYPLPLSALNRGIYVVELRNTQALLTVLKFVY